MCFNRPLINTQSYHPLLPQSFICLSSTQHLKKKLFLGRKTTGSHLPPLRPPPAPQITPMRHTTITVTAL